MKTIMVSLYAAIAVVLMLTVLCLLDMPIFYCEYVATAELRPVLYDHGRVINLCEPRSALTLLREYDREINDHKQKDKTLRLISASESNFDAGAFVDIKRGSLRVWTSAESKSEAVRLVSEYAKAIVDQIGESRFASARQGIAQLNSQLEQRERRLLSIRKHLDSVRGGGNFDIKLSDEYSYISNSVVAMQTSIRSMEEYLKPKNMGEGIVIVHCDKEEEVLDRFVIFGMWRF